MPQSSPTPRRGRPGYDRQTLLAECVELFNRHGYEAVSYTHLTLPTKA